MNAKTAQENQLDTDVIMAKLPKKTPAWAVGVVAIIVSLVTSFSAFYLLSKDDIRTYVGNYQSEKIREEIGLESRYTMTLNTVLSLVDTNTKQITSLSAALAVAQHENASLADRVSQLEKNLAISAVDLKNCEAKLVVCKGK